MNKREKAIVESLKKFRVLDRDQLIALHFSHLKSAVLVCNRTLRRMRDRDQVSCDTSVQPYNYFSNPPQIRKDSMKLPHFKSITNFYLEASKFGTISDFEVEFKTGEKGSIEPDFFMVWNNAPFFVEIQRSVYTKKVMDAKLNRYETYFKEGEWKNGHWQGEKSFFPYVLIISDHVYNGLTREPLKILQAKDMNDFVRKYVRK